MATGYATLAIQSVLNSGQAYCKFLSANDSGATGGHQSGILISKTAKQMMFTQNLDGESILSRMVKIRWQDNACCTESRFTYYSSKNELRITRFGRNFPFLHPELTGALLILTRQDTDEYSGFFLETEEDIEQFLSAFSIAPTETNRMIDSSNILLSVQEEIAIQEFVRSLTDEFPQSEAMSKAARRIQDSVYGDGERIRTDPDRKIINWTNMEYALFRAIEHARYGDRIARGFVSVDEFVTMANMVLNRRKSRAGKSLEHHLSAIFEGNGIAYDEQKVTEGNKRPDFLFPSQRAYHDTGFPVEKLISLAAKTTCKDRWRQVINEADRLRGRPKYLCTLQQGISPAQMDEMQSENVILVVPRPYIGAYPKDRQERIWTVSKFIAFIREVEEL